MAPSSDLEVRARARIGTTLMGKYRLDAVLGIGGMAAVFAATHRNTKRVAVKILHPEASANFSIRSHFLREGYVANSVGHPGAVKVDDDDVTEDGTVFIVMELLDGIVVEDLRERFGGKLSVHAGVSIVGGLLDVLAAAHAHPIIHRDIKPANLFLVRDGSLKVLDFGIARIRDAATRFGAGPATGTGESFGTPGFMAPEQALGDSQAIDARTDIWAASATLFKLLTGELVHAARSPQELRVCAARDEARRIDIVNPGVPLAIAHVVNRGLAREKEGRWRTAAEMREALQSAYRKVYGRLSPPVTESQWEPTPPRPLGLVEATDAIEQGSVRTSLKPIASDMRPKKAKRARTIALLTLGGAASVAMVAVLFGFAGKPPPVRTAVGAGSAPVPLIAEAPLPVEEVPTLQRDAGPSVFAPPPTKASSVRAVPPSPSHAGTVHVSAFAAPRSCDPPTYLDLDAGIKRPKPWCI